MYGCEQMSEAGGAADAPPGDYDLFRRGASDTLDVVFCRAFTAPRSFQLARLPSPNSQLFLNVRGNDYYQRGIPGVTRSIEETASWLLDVAARCGAARIRTMGISMGAYAALLFGHLVGAEAIYACAPRLTLGRPSCRSWRWNRARVYHPAHRDLSVLLPGLVPRASLVFPAFDIMDHHDIVLAMRAVGPGRVRLVRAFHPCRHGFDWARIVATPAPLGFGDDILGRAEHRLAGGIDDLARLARAYTAVAERRFADALALLAQSAPRDPDNAGIHYQIGMMHALLGDLERASTALRGAGAALWNDVDSCGPGAGREERWRARVSADYGGLLEPRECTLLAGLLPPARADAAPRARCDAGKHES